MRKSSLAVLAAAAALMSYATTASAADTMARVTSAKLSEILSATTGKTATVTKPEAGVEVVTINDGLGDVDFIMSECTSQGCLIVQMTTYFEKDNRFNLGVVNSYNSKSLNAQAFLTQDNGAGLVRLYLVHGGVTEDNLKANLTLYFGAPGIFADHVISSQTIASTGSGPITVAAPATAPVAAGTGPQASVPTRMSVIERPGRKGRPLQQQ